MSKRFHPVSLHVIRGALIYAGFTVGKIRTLVQATPDQPIATYDVILDSIKGLDASAVPPCVVQAAANAAFTGDVSVPFVFWNGENWSLRLVASTVPQEGRALEVAPDGTVIGLPWNPDWLTGGDA